VPRRVILIVIDGLTPGVFEAAVGDRRAPTLTLLAEHGQYARATSTFPSLTPVCLSSIATGAHSDVHHIPHLVWYHRGERRIVEYGSSFAAVRAAGMARSIVDTIINMNRSHLAEDAVTLFEAVEDAGLTPAAINLTCYRGRTRHLPTLPGITIPAYGPRRFFYYNLFESDVTGAPLAVFARAAGSIDGYAAAVGRWLVTRDGFDFLAYYLPDYDFASHVYGPEGTAEALARSDAAVRALLDAAGGPDEFLERYAVVLCSDHGQTRVAQHTRLETPFAALSDVIVTASNRAGMVYRVGPRAPEPRELAELLAGEEAAEVVLFREGDEAVARRAGEEVRFSPGTDAGWLADYPDGAARAWAALQNPNSGEVLVSAREGYEFADLAGRHHVGGGSHGSLEAGDSEVPMLTLGLEVVPRSIVEIAPAVLGHLGIELPPYQRALVRAV
jgi:predicted AlkP superfamily pyrophosphatase or phosphodiesterase